MKILYTFFLIFLFCSCEHHTSENTATSSIEYSYAYVHKDTEKLISGDIPAYYLSAIQHAKEQHPPGRIETRMRYYKNLMRLDDVTHICSEVFDDTSLSEAQIIDQTAVFVQNLEYISERKFRGYAKFPVETLLDGGGDCEDTAILLCALLDAKDISVVLFYLKNHFAVGVACERCSGVYYEYNNTKYYFLETTAKHWKPGMIPPEHVHKKVTIFPWNM